jgi:putative DNA primase/helicase
LSKHHQKASLASDKKSPLWYAEQYHRAGMCPIPIKPRSKKPINDEWPTLRIPYDDLKYHFSEDQNIGVILGDASGGLVDIDLDSAEAVRLGPAFLPPTDFVFGYESKPRSHWGYYVANAPRTKQFKDGEMIVEIRGNGGYSVVPGSVHEDTGELILFSLDNDDEIPQPAAIDLAVLNFAVINIAIGSIILRNWSTGGRHHLTLAIAGFLAKCGWSEDEVSRLVGAVARCANDTEVDGRLSDVRTTFERYRAGNVITGINALRDAVGNESVTKIETWLGKGEAPVSIPLPANSNNLITSTSFCTDADAARTFSKCNEQTVKFCSDRDQWYLKTQAVYDPVGQTEMQGKVSDLVEQVTKTHPMIDVKAMRSRGRINATIELSRSHNLISIHDIDRDKHFVGLKNGQILDLGTREHVYQTDVFVTKRLGTDFYPDAQCPEFESFLHQIFEGDREMIEFIRRAVGYSLCGETTEQCLFFLVGAGANGKSTLLNILNRLFGDYAGTTPMQTLTISRTSSGQTNDLAAMEGKRFVSASDGEADQKLAVNKIKSLTGSDPITCRALYKDYTTFVPEAKFWIATNDVPEASGADEALMRRLKIIHFPVVIPAEQRDQNLGNVLADELPGILNWALKGYEDWRSSKLCPPAAVSSATSQYRQDNDPVGQFIDERCALNVAAHALARDLYRAYALWCEGNSLSPLSSDEFGKVLGRKGFKKKKKNGGLAGWLGLEPLQKKN